MRPDDIHGQAQQAAEEYLQERGIKILDRNWRSDGCELPIIAATRDTLVVCVLVTRMGTRYADPLERAGNRHRARLRRGAVQWLTAHGARYDKIRIDVIGLLHEGIGGFTIEHVRGVG